METLSVLLNICEVVGFVWPGGQAREAVDLEWYKLPNIGQWAGLVWPGGQAREAVEWYELLNVG